MGCYINGVNIFVWGELKMKVYLVAQNASHDIENEYNFLWSPKLTKSGGRNLGYENMKQVRKGDVILHSFDQAIKGISVAVDDVYSADRPDFFRI